MAENLWRAGAVDNIFAPYDWSNGTLQPGDTLVIGSGMAFLGDSDVYGDTVLLAGEGSRPTLVAYGSADVKVQVGVSAAVPTGSPAGGAAPSGTVEVAGAPTVSLQVNGSQGVDAAGTVEIDPYSQMRGGFTATGSNATVTVDGGGTSTFANTASALTGNFEVATVNTLVVGDGTFDVGQFDSMRFTAGVGAGQMVNDNGGVLTIADPHAFHAAVDWTPPAAAGGSTDHIALSNLVADHAAYADGVLSLTSGGVDVLDLRLHVPGADAVAAQGSGGIDVYASAAAAAAAGASVIAHS